MVNSQGNDSGADPRNAEDGPKQVAFQPLQQSAFSALEHGAFLKGLLKPFKGKGELIEMGDWCCALTEGLVELAMQNVLAQAERYPFTLLPIRLVRQSTGAGTVFLRWSRMDRSKMGVDLWAELMSDERTPFSLISDLYALEIQRIIINMQISLTHSISRQAFLCAGKVDLAERAYQRRMLQHANSHPVRN
ncbi:DUF3158 family protein [Pseudomonas gingeri]|uniref:DUF3158 family protein n=1 Tax=Pseudomonas gingeri TaxID=117681 RepID=UPI00159FFE76|nr:DUF3158 family protein [Pseudomonas gingeri]NWA05401.1 DUF3158 family protein [Pseudomonas gingeri]NWA17824.1 DUF3158 family protein [Pseudomonas gingeri]NWA57788.1 DUF3158 family protein [Pseudomonas gingeri]NWA98809.1 DUF3158 family protein [Pseudomonas gingeri]NWB05935.1 DUF3158 family protein [Pseudomonas gingeri]